MKYPKYQSRLLFRNISFNRIGRGAGNIPTGVYHYTGILSFSIGSSIIPCPWHGRIHSVRSYRTHKRVGTLNASTFVFPTVTRYSFIGALLTRFFLGIVEAAFTTGALFLLSKWYTRRELSTWTADFCGNSISNAFGALIPSRILDGKDGKLGKAAGRWLFYIEGSLTIFIAICAIFILPDFPATTRWLAAQERRLTPRQTEEDAGVGDEGETRVGGLGHGLWLALKDWSVWLMILAIANQMSALTLKAYFPSLTATLGFGSTVMLPLCTPPSVLTTITMFKLSRSAFVPSEVDRS